jgi:hypothetical protein
MLGVQWGCQDWMWFEREAALQGWAPPTKEALALRSGE